MMEIVLWYLALCYAPLLIPGYSEIVWHEARMGAEATCRDIPETEREAAIESVVNVTWMFTPIGLMNAFILMLIGSWITAFSMLIARLF